MMLTHDTEPKIFYEKTFGLHLIEIWNRRIVTPFGDIFLFDDDVKGAFRHYKYHPDVAAAFAFIIRLFCLSHWEVLLDILLVQRTSNQLHGQGHI